MEFADYKIVLNKLFYFHMLLCFRLDPEIKRLCKDDAKAVCGASSLNDQESYPNSLVISCLYRNSVLDTQTKVKSNLLNTDATLRHICVNIRTVHTV